MFFFFLAIHSVMERQCLQGSIETRFSSVLIDTYNDSQSSLQGGVAQFV